MTFSQTPWSRFSIVKATGPAERLAAPQTPREAGLVPFDLHPAAAPVAVLAAREIGIDRRRDRF